MRGKNLINGQVILDAVSYSYGGLPVLQKINFRVEKGEFVVIVGPSGCGKTTLLNLLAGHIIPTTGTVKSKGVIRSVYQDDGLFPWLTVKENINMGLRSLLEPTKGKKEVEELINLVNLKGFENYYPHQLSGGMRQRVELARVLAGSSDIILMDEPFKSLDYITRYTIRNELVKLLIERPRTVILVTHDIEEAALLADRILIVSKRPAHICQEILIEEPRPRRISDNVVIQTIKNILNESVIKEECNLTT